MVSPGALGDLFQDQTNGGLWSYEGTGWARLSTVPIPPGMIMGTMRSDEPMGWLRMDGRSVDQPTAGGLWAAFPEWRSADGTKLKLPDARGRYLRHAQLNLQDGADSVTLQVANMPAHRHIDRDANGAVTTFNGGAHTHTASIGPGGDHYHTTDPAQGTHGHDVDDVQHAHHWADGGAGGAFVAALWLNCWRIDGPFNDGSLPGDGRPGVGRRDGASGVQVKSGGAHGHTTNSVPHTVTPSRSSRTPPRRLPATTASPSSPSVAGRRSTSCRPSSASTT